MAIDLVSVQVILTVTQAQLKVVATRSAAKFLFRLGSNIYADFFQSAIQIQEFHVFITSKKKYLRKIVFPIFYFS